MIAYLLTDFYRTVVDRVVGLLCKSLSTHPKVVKEQPSWSLSTLFSKMALSSASVQPPFAASLSGNPSFLAYSFHSTPSSLMLYSVVIKHLF